MDGFGVLAQRGQKTFCRQTLVGGNYGLLNTTNLTPNPDYYALLLWRKLMGQGVLNVTDDGTNTNLRAYAHCHGNTKIGDVAVLLMNLSNKTKTKVTLNVGDASTIKDEYVMSSESISSQRVMLNGKYLETNQDGVIPTIQGKESVGNVVELEPLTYGFYVLKNVKAKGCL